MNAEETHSQPKLGFVSVLLALVLAFAMTPVAALQMAYADEGIDPQTSVVEGWDIQFNNQTVTVEAGQQINMNNYIKKGSETIPEGETGHLDWFIETPDTPEGEEPPTIASINKHSGMLTATDSGTVTVRVCLVKGPQRQVQGLCGEEMAYATKDVTITAKPAEYGFQGGSNAIHMIFPEVTSFSGDMESGYVNEIEEAHASGGYVYFTYETTTGFTRHDSVDAYTKLNAGQIVLDNGNGKTYTLGDEKQGVLTVSSLNSSLNQVTVRVATDYLPKGYGTLTFMPGLRGNSDERTLETTVSFDFNVVE